MLYRLSVAVVLIVAMGGSLSGQGLGGKLPGDLAELLDGDENGKITDEELKFAVEQFKKEANVRPKTERSKLILDALDLNKDGKLDDAEATQGAVRGRMEKGGNSDAVGQIFKRLDMNADGFIGADEFGKVQALLAVVNPEAAQGLADLFDVLDANNDKAISVVESQVAADLFAKEGGGFGGGGGRAADAPKENPKIRAYVTTTFAQRDRNKDGLISEVEAKRDTALKREFAAADGNGNKLLTPDELYAYLQQKFAAQP